MPASPGRSILRLLPAAILLPAGVKLAANYHRVAVGPDGLRAGGTWSLAERQPTVSIARPARISAEFPDMTCMAQLRVRATDLRPPLQVKWSADGLVANPGARSTPIVFDVRGARPAQVLAKTVTVRVKDADGLTAEARSTVPVHVTWDALAVGPPGAAPLVNTVVLGRTA
jgi:hypothetical protein